jgi:hypothetical protein
MKKAKLHKFLKTISRADAIVLIKEPVFDLINFNDHVTIEKYQTFLEEESQVAFFEHLDNLTSSNGDSSIYLKSLQRQFENVLSYFTDSNGFLILKKLTISDVLNHSFSFDEIPVEVKQKISSFLSVQKYAIRCFLSKLDQNENQPPTSTLKWNPTKTDLVELGNALYEGGCVGSEKGPIPKKEFMQHFASVFNIQLNSWEKTLSKAMLRENPAQFIDRLKSILTDYCDKNINIINGGVPHTHP